MDLFTPIVLKEQQHQNFRYITQPGFCDPELEVLKDWVNGFLDRDGKFVKEFQTTFNSSFWELYLHACFKELDCTVDFSYPTPDFFVHSPYGDFIAEATTANHPENFRPEWDRDLKLLEETSMEDLLRLSIIRLSNAIASKYKKYKSKYSQLSHVQNKPFIICVAPFDQPFFYLQDSLAIVQLLYAYAGPLVHPDSQQGEVIIIGDARRFRVQKSPGVNINLGLFTNPDMAEVSAVIFNNRATFSKVRAIAREGSYPVLFSGSRFFQSEQETGLERFVEYRPNYQETLLDGLHILINPFANNHLDLRMFDDREVAFHTFDPETDSYISEIPNGFLLQRMCHSITSDNVTEEFKQSIIQNYQELAPETWEEDQLIYVGGQNDPFHDNHMAHYRGWTVIVSLCSIDKDWGAQAVNSLRHNVAQFIQANGDEDIASIGNLEWFLTKEEAYEEIKSRIDQLVDKIDVSS